MSKLFLRSFGIFQLGYESKWRQFVFELMFSPRIDKMHEVSFRMIRFNLGRFFPQDAARKLGFPFFVLLFAAFSASATTFTVNTYVDSGDPTSCNSVCSLRGALYAASQSPGADTVAFDPGVFSVPRVISLDFNYGSLTINDASPLTINGPGATLLTISGYDFTNNTWAGFWTIINQANLTINGVTIDQGRTESIKNEFNGRTLTINNSYVKYPISNNVGATLQLHNSWVGFQGRGNLLNYGTLIATNSLFQNARRGVENNSGAAIDNLGPQSTANITNSTISENHRGIRIVAGSSVTVKSSTIAFNGWDSFVSGGGVLNEAGGTAVFKNTVVSDNLDSVGSASDFTGILSSQGYNLIKSPVGMTITGVTTGNIIGESPRLNGLDGNGVTVPTHALGPGSPAVDAGDPADFPVTDQRGIIRPQDGDLNGSAVPDIGSFESQSTIPPPRTAFDFDGDSKTDLAIFRPSGANGAEWWWLKSTGGNGAVQFGGATDTIAAADFTGDGKTDVVFWRPSTGQWYVLRSEDFSFYAFPFGSNGDVPVPADYDGDGKADAAIYRPSALTWYISKSTGGTDIVGFGAAGDKPIATDYDGDGKADIAVFRPNGANGAEWWIRRSGNLSVFATQFGAATDKALPADYTGDGKADVAFWRPSTGQWYILRSEDSSFFAFPFGTSTDVPTPGDYDGDGKTDAAVFRPSTSTWFAQRSTAGILIQQFGATGDVPVPGAYVR